MISVVISTYKPDNFNAISESIQNTIGVFYELIKITNNGELTIHQAYNKGLSIAKYNSIVFVHDDVIFNTQGWGKHIINHFEKDKKIALIGVAGSSAKTKAPSAWSWNGKKNNFHYLIQYHNGKLDKDYTGKDAYLPKNSTFETLLIDGLFIAMRKNAGLKFDERLIAFHEYDLSISLNAHINGWKNIITTYISLTHFSLGKRDEKWIESADIFSDLYNDALPVCLSSAKEKIGEQLEITNYKRFINLCLANNNKRLAYKYFTRLRTIAFYNLSTYRLWIKILRKTNRKK